MQPDVGAAPPGSSAPGLTSPTPVGEGADSLRQQADQSAKRHPLGWSSQAEARANETKGVPVGRNGAGLNLKAAMASAGNLEEQIAVLQRWITERSELPAVIHWTHQLAKVGMDQRVLAELRTEAEQRLLPPSMR